MHPTSQKGYVPDLTGFCKAETTPGSAQLLAAGSSDTAAKLDNPAQAYPADQSQPYKPTPKPHHIPYTSGRQALQTRLRAAVLLMTCLARCLAFRQRNLSQRKRLNDSSTLQSIFRF
jgi:hypothetical protein